MIGNEITSIELFIKAIRALKDFSWQDCLVCMEHTGIYNAHLLAISQKYKWHLCLESGLQIKQSGGLQRGKNDIIDSYRIALYAYKNASGLKLWQPPRKVLVNLQKLSGLRCRLINARKQLSTAAKEDKKFLDKSIVKSIEQCSKGTMAALDKGIKMTDKKIKAVIASDEALKKIFALVESVPGIGNVMAVQMVITTNEFTQIIDPRKYACYCGVAPFEHSSGSSIRGRTRTSKKANQHVKSILHMGSLTVVRTNEEMKKYYDKKVNEGKNKMSVLNAVKNKMIHRVFSCIGRNEPYPINYKNNLAVS
jgi:transposase